MNITVVVCEWQLKQNMSCIEGYNLGDKNAFMNDVKCLHDQEITVEYLIYVKEAKIRCCR